FLVLKVMMGSFLASHYLRDLFIPFVNYFVESGFSNPWQYFGSINHWDSFPYPPAMLFPFALARAVFHPLLPAGIWTVSMGHFLVMRLPLLFADLTILGLLLKWFPSRSSRVLWLYWASPLAIYISYWHGQLDIIPTALFLVSVYLICEQRFTWGWALFA